MRRKAATKSEPSLVDELSKPLRSFVEDLKQHSNDALRTVRERNPEKYLELSTKLLPLVAALNPGKNDFADAKDMQSIGIAILKSVGFNDPDAASINEALRVQDQSIDHLQAIRARAEGELQ